MAGRRSPPNPPMKQFWAVTIYQTETRTLIQNGEKHAEISSQTPGLKINADGSVGVYVGPAAPKGFESNWVKSVPGKAWFAYFRLYAPIEAYFDQSWPPAGFWEGEMSTIKKTVASLREIIRISLAQRRDGATING